MTETAMPKEVRYRMSKTLIPVKWSCSNHVQHEHRYKWVAWLCGRWQFYIGIGVYSKRDREH